MEKNLLNKILVFSAVILIIGVCIPSTIGEREKKNSGDLNIFNHSTGLAPKMCTQDPIFKTAVESNNELKTTITRNAAKITGDIMHGYVAYDPSGQLEEGPCYFPLDDPGTITPGCGKNSPPFFSGGTWTTDEKWLCVEYSSGVLWEIDIEDCSYTSIGGGGTGLNGLAYDPICSLLFGAGSSGLYGIDPETGEQEYIGEYGSGPGLMIGIACNEYGTLYGWDISSDNLWEIDKETADCSLVGSLGININYAQDGAFDWDTGILYLSAYTTTGQLYTCDKETGACTLVGNFQGGAEITGSMIQSSIWIDHDITLRSINYPEDSGYALPEIPMQVQVRNYGMFQEITDIKMQVNKYKAGPLIFEEDFQGIFPPNNWTTDWWRQSNTSIAGGILPEARCNKYTQKNNSSYYNNYIQCPPINCSGVEKVNLNFRWSADVQYNNYCSVYVKYRKNITSAWKDISPWYNPLSGDIECEEFEIGIYGDPYLGEEFQVKWEYLGYYYYFNDWFLDDVRITKMISIEDYNEIVEDVEIPASSNIIVDFPTWAPTDWQNTEFENTWQEYYVRACTLLVDDNPKNNCKQKIIDLYYPWLHDIEITSIDSPCEDGPGKTYPVQATIKNVGKSPECCIPINITIGESVVIDTILNEYSWDTVPPAGWTDEHKNYVSYYGWNISNTSYSGGISPEARLPYYYALADYVFYSDALNTSEFPSCNVEFLSYINHYSGSELYTLEAGYSYDGETWIAAWSEAPSCSGKYNVSVPIEIKYGTTFIGFWIKGDPWYMNYWYLDNIVVKAVDILEEEYSDYMCHGPDLEPGETRIFEFDNWTPDFLQYETTGTKKYIVTAKINMEGDKNLGNDISGKEFKLDYWHDVNIKDLASPNMKFKQNEEWLHFDDGTTVNSLGATCACTFQYAIRLTPEELAPWEGYSITTVKRHHGYNKPFHMPGKIKIYEQGTATQPGDLITEEPFEYYQNEWHDIELSDPVPIYGDQDIWVSCEVSHDAGEYPAGMDPSLNYPGKGNWIYLSSWVQVSIYGFYCDWNLWAGIGPISVWPYAYIKPGTKDINVTVENSGTFPEFDLTCYAEMYEFFTNCTNGTLLYEDNITDIDLDIPLEGKELLDFDEYNFSNEGMYGLFLNIPDENDDIPNNNEEIYGIVVDDTSPFSVHSFDPQLPDGENGWYVSDLEVTINAIDPEISCGWSSGIKEIWYKIGTHDWKKGFGSKCTFIVDEDGDDLLIQYFAVDYVGNIEEINSFTIDMDQTEPDISLIYEIVGGNALQGWDFVFTATATDETSGMSHVDFYLNGLYQEKIIGPGPTYEWGFTYHGDLYIVIEAIACDMAGNFESDEIEDPENFYFNQLQVNSKKVKHEINKSLKNILSYKEVYAI